MNTEDEEFARIEREINMRQVPDAIHHTDTSETMEYIQGWNDCRQVMLAEQPAQQGPVGEVNRYGLDSHGRKWHCIHWYDPNVDVPHGTKLYTTPQAQRKPLTDDQIHEMANDFEEGYVFLYRRFARAIEAAHGIKEST